MDRLRHFLRLCILFFSIRQFLKVTVLPMETSSWSTPSLSMISAKRIIFSNVVIRPSTKACSSLADSYSEFSERSPKLRAILIRSTISLRLIVLILLALVLIFLFLQESLDILFYHVNSPFSLNDT